MVPGVFSLTSKLLRLQRQRKHYGHKQDVGTQPCIQQLFQIYLESSTAGNYNAITG